MKVAVWAVCLILFGIIIMITAFIMWLKARSFGKNGVSCKAWVTEARAIRVSGSKHTNSYGLIVKYVVDGIEYASELPVGRDEYEKGADREIVILYKESNPKKIFPGEVEISQNSVKIFLTAGVVSTGIGIILLAVAILRARA